MQTATTRPATAPPTPPRDTIPVKHITVNGLHKTAALLGGREERTTTTHNYVAYRLGTGRHVHLPNAAKKGTGIVGRKHLRKTLTQFLNAGVPHGILEQALDLAGATWHQPPKKNHRIRDTLKNNPEAARAAKWRAIDPTLPTEPAPPPATEPKTTTMNKNQTANEKVKPERRDWCGLDLHEVAQLDLPVDADQSAVHKIVRAISRNFTVGIEPYASLLREGHVTRQRKGGRHGRYEYQITEHAAAILGADARARYDALIPPTQETPAPNAPSPEPRTATPPTLNTPGPAPEPPPTPTSPPPEPLTLNEAIGALIRRHNVTPPLDENLRLDLQRFVIELEKATRPT